MRSGFGYRMVADDVFAKERLLSITLWGGGGGGGGDHMTTGM